VENKSVGWDDFLTSLFQIIIGVEMTDEYYNDYPNEPIGGDNPYYRCSYCKISDPQINGYLENHEVLVIGLGVSLPMKKQRHK